MCELAEGFPTIWAAVASHLRMALQIQRVGEGFEAKSAVQEVGIMGLLVIEEGTGMSVGASTLITSAQKQDKCF